MGETEGKKYMYRGRAIIIANKKFLPESELKNRQGSKKDLKMMKDLFTSLDFEVKAYINLTGDKMREKLEKAKEWKHGYDPSCFVCVISSHGEELKDVKTSTWHPSVCGTDGDRVYVNDITRMYSDTNCEKYSGKPKLFFMQACRSSLGPAGRQHLMYDGGVTMTVLSSNNKTDEKGDHATDQGDSTTEVEQEISADRLSKGTSADSVQSQKQLPESTVDQDLSEDEWDGSLSDDEDEAADAGQGDASDSKGNQEGVEAGPSDTSDVKAGTQQGKMPEPLIDMVDVNCPKNCLIMFPVMSGRVAFRNSESGSWMLYFMYENASILHSQQNVLQYLTKVCQRMAEYSYDPDSYPKGMSPDDVAKLPSKMCSCIIHKLTQPVQFEPRGKRPLTDVLKEQFNRVFPCIL